MGIYTYNKRGVKGWMLLYRKIHEMIRIILIIGILNIYDIIKNVNISIFEVIKINEKNQIYIILITIIFTIIFNKNNTNTNKNTIINSMEFELIIGLGFIGLNMLILSNDFIILFLSIELYSLSVYLLLFKNNPSQAKISILYFLIGSISSSIILLGISIFYKYTGSLEIEYIIENIEKIIDYQNKDSKYLLLGFGLFFLGLLFKLGSAPFQFWVIRVYNKMDIKILIYQSIIPKIVFIYFLYKFILNFPINNNFISSFLLILLFSAFLSLFIGPIGALNKGIHSFKKIIAYSSILHVGYLLLGIVSNYYSEEIFLNVFQYLLIYSFNTFQFLFAFLFLQNMLSTSSLNLKINIPILFSYLLISIFSFIGLPPFAGFYGKLNIILNCMNTNNILLESFAIIFIVFSTLIALFIYLKFINYLYFTPNYFISNSNSNSNQNDNIDNISNNNNLFFSYFLSFLTFFLLFYPFFLPYLSPLFELLSL